MSIQGTCLDLVAVEVFCSKLEHAFKYAPGMEVLLIPVKKEEVKEIRRALLDKEVNLRHQCK